MMHACFDTVGLLAILFGYCLLCFSIVQYNHLYGIMVSFNEPINRWTTNEHQTIYIFKVERRTVNAVPVPETL